MNVTVINVTVIHVTVINVIGKRPEKKEVKKEGNGKERCLHSQRVIRFASRKEGRYAGLGTNVRFGARSEQNFDERDLACQG